MSARTVILALGCLLTTILVTLGFVLFPPKDFLLNLLSEAVGIIAGGLVLFALVEAYMAFQKRREWKRVQDELFSRIYWEIEILQFSVQPTASWGIGRTLGEDLVELVKLGPNENPIPARYFLDLAENLDRPLDSLNLNITPRVVALTDDNRLTHTLLELEETGLKIKAVRHSLSEDSSESYEFTKLVNELLKRAAAVIDYLDQKLYGEDLQKAAQARFKRLDGLPFSTSWSSDRRTIYKADGTPYGLSA